MLPFWNFQKTTIFFGTAKPTLPDSLNFSKFPGHGFCIATNVMRKGEVKTGRQAKMEGTCSGYS